MNLTPQQMVHATHEELRAGNPDLSDVRHGVWERYQVSLTIPETARLLSQPLECGAPMGNQNAAGPHKGFGNRDAGFPKTDIHGNAFGGLRKSQATALAKAHDAAMFKPKSPEEFAAHKASRDANIASENAFHSAGKENEEKLHTIAADANTKAGRLQRSNGEWKSARQHEQAAAGHETVANNLAWEKAGKPEIKWDSSD